MENTNLAERDFFYLREKMRKQNRVWKKIKEGKLKKLTAQLLWMYLYVRRYWLLIAFYVLLGASGSVLSLGFSLVTRDLVDAVTGMNTKGIGRVVALYVGVGVGQIFVNAVKTRISFQIRLKVTNEIRADIYEQVLHTDWASLAGYRSGDLLFRVNGDAGAVANSVLTFLPNAVTALISFGGAFVIMVSHDPAMAALALAGGPVSFLATRCTTRRLRRFQRENQEVASDRTVFDQETFQNLQFIKAFGMLNQVTEKFYHIQRRAMDVAARQNRFQAYRMMLTSLIGQGIGYACYGFAIYRLWQGEITYGTMTMFVGMAGALRGSFNSILSLAPTAVRACVSAERIMEVVSLPRELLEDEEAAKRMKETGRQTGVYVQMRAVDFAYEGQKWVYQKADFEANPGEIVALIGPSGQGKTTTLNLLLGLYHPSSGDIRLGNPGGESLEISSSTRCMFSYIPQGNTLFSGTIRENMLMAKPQAGEEEIIAALKSACAWEFVQKLEDGLETQVRERGQRFSEGQKQRLSIARALLADAPVLILDEATSALDVVTERRVLNNIIKREPYRTVIVAAHRPSVFTLCSRVYKIQDGGFSQVDERGLQEFLEAF